MLYLKEFTVNKQQRFDIQTSSKGNQTKWVVGDYFIKADTFGYESVAEIISYIFCKNAGIKCIKYAPCIIKENQGIGVQTYRGCYSKNILHNNEFIRSFHRVLKNRYTKSEIEQFWCDYYCRGLVDKIAYEVSDITGVKIEAIMNYLSTVCKLDALIINEDRHINNLALIEKDGKYKTAPIFDNGFSLLSFIRESPLEYDFRELIQYKRAKPFFRDFDLQAGYFKEYPLLKVDYKKLIADLQKVNISGYEIYIERAISVLLYRLEQTRGVLWNEI